VNFTSIPDPDGTQKPCPRCGHSTVLVNTGTGLERVHTGTFEGRCHTTTSRRTT
jgi:ribosomal protein S27AE